MRIWYVLERKSPESKDKWSGSPKRNTNHRDNPTKECSYRMAALVWYHSFGWSAYLFAESARLGCGCLRTWSNCLVAFYLGDHSRFYFPFGCRYAMARLDALCRDSDYSPPIHAAHLCYAICIEFSAHRHRRRCCTVGRCNSPGI